MMEVEEVEDLAVSSAIEDIHSYLSFYGTVVENARGYGAYLCGEIKEERNFQPMGY